MTTEYIEKIKSEIVAKDQVYIQRVATEIIQGFDAAIEAEIRSSDNKTHTGLTKYHYMKYAEADAKGSWDVMGYPSMSTSYRFLHRDICEKVRNYIKSVCGEAWYEVAWETCPFKFSAPYVKFRILINWNGEKPKHLQLMDQYDMEYSE